MQVQVKVSNLGSWKYLDMFFHDMFSNLLSLLILAYLDLYFMTHSYQV